MSFSVNYCKPQRMSNGSRAHQLANCNSECTRLFCFAFLVLMMRQCVLFLLVSCIPSEWKPSNGNYSNLDHNLAGNIQDMRPGTLGLLNNLVPTRGLERSTWRTELHGRQSLALNGREGNKKKVLNVPSSRRKRQLWMDRYSLRWGPHHTRNSYRARRKLPLQRPEKRPRIRE